MTICWLILGSTLRFAAAEGAGPHSGAHPLQIPVNHGPSAYVNAWWWSVASKPQANASNSDLKPAVLLLHGCGGMLNREGQPDQRMTSYAARLNEKGWHVLALDSFSSRGVREICTRDKGQPSNVSQALRRADVASAFNWLSHQAMVDTSRLALIGWSNGGSTVLEYIHRGHSASTQAVYPGLRAAAAFYPGCAFRESKGFDPTVPLLLLLGSADDWTPPEPCLRLASQKVEVRAWENAYHGFDGVSRLRFRSDIRTGVNPNGVHQGANRVAGEEARSALFTFLERALERSPSTE